MCKFTLLHHFYSGHPVRALNGIVIADFRDLLHSPPLFIKGIMAKEEATPTYSLFLFFAFW